MPAADPLWLHSINTNECIRLRNATDILKCLWFLYSYSFPLQSFSLSPYLFSSFGKSWLVPVYLVHNYTKPNFLHFPSTHSHLFSARTMFFVPLDWRKIAVHSGAGKMKYTSEHCGHHVMFVNDPLRSTRKKCWAVQKRKRDLEQWYTVLHVWELIHSLVLQAERVCN